MNDIIACLSVGPKHSSGPRVAMVEASQHTMGLSEGYIPSRLDSRLSEEGVFQNLTWNDTRSRIQVRWERSTNQTIDLQHVTCIPNLSADM